MSCLFGRLRLTNTAVEKNALHGLAVNQSTRRVATPSFATPRAIHIPSANIHNEPCSMWTMGALSKKHLPSDAEIFNFTRGRFVDNEEDELSQRHRTFNVTELARQAAYITQTDRCVSIRKYSDGMHNRVLLLSMNNGKEVVAKIPNPNSGQPHFTTASEVATMKFVSILVESFAADSHICQAREVLRTPLPEAYAWSSRAHETPVGAEFILMEKMNGVELETILPRMKIQDRLEVVKTIAGYQKSWASVSFEQSGSLYFPDDVDGSALPTLTYIDYEGRKVSDPRFVVRPSTGREMFDDGRGTIEFDRGPCKFRALLWQTGLT
jgi:hypothetical protein